MLDMAMDRSNNVIKSLKGSSNKFNRLKSSPGILDKAMDRSNNVIQRKSRTYRVNCKQVQCLNLKYYA